MKTYQLLQNACGLLGVCILLSATQLAAQNANQELSLSCGTMALHEVGLVIMGGKYDASAILNASPKPSGFSMSELLALADKSGLQLEALKMSGENKLIVPSVAHLRNDHYIAILEKKGESYKTFDPLHRKVSWQTLKEIRLNSSGNYLAPKGQSQQWKRLTLAATDQIRGKHISPPGPNDEDPGDDDPCNENEDEESGDGGSCPADGGCGDSDGDGTSDCDEECDPNSGGPGGGGAGGAGGGPGGGGMPPIKPGIGTSIGMATWGVTEPYINLFISDEPLGYQPALGSRIALKLSYKQRSSTIPSEDFFHVGTNWNFSWRTYIQETSDTTATLYLSGGGSRKYANGITEYYGKTQLERLTSNDILIGFQLNYPSGSKEIYSCLVGATPDIALLTERITSPGHITRFQYETNSGIVQLKYVIDADGMTNTLTYTNSASAALVTGVQDPFGRKATLEYDGLLLTNIIDVIGISSSFRYETNLWITNLVTPYGTTHFEFTQQSSNGVAFGGDNIINRTILVTTPDGGKQLYMYRDKSEYLYTSTETNAFLPNAYSGAMVPTNTLVGTLDNTNMFWRNSFYWGKRQYLALSTTNINEFTTNDYNKGRLKHWLQKQTDPPQVRLSISMVRQPSSDSTGTNYGQMTWYDYYGKVEVEREGTNSTPDAITRVFPDGSHWHRLYQKNHLGKPTSIVQTYSSGSSVLLRTNSYEYSEDGINLIRKIGPLGETHATYGYNTKHQVLFSTNAVGYVLMNTYDAQGRLIRIQRPSGLTTTNIYFSSGIYSNWIQKTIDLEINRTNSYAYENGLLLTHTNERGMVLNYSWDALQRLRKVTHPDSTYITNAYDKLDLVQTIDRMGYTNSFGYDAVRRMIRMTNALGYVTTNSYCICGSLDSITDALGITTSFTYDLRGKRIKTTFADGGFVTNVFNLVGQLERASDSSGNWITNHYNNQGLLITASNTAGRVFSSSYDIEDRVISSMSANGVNFDATYDDLGRVLTRTYPDLGVEQFAYSLRGLSIYTNQLGYITYYGYNEAGWKTFETNANSDVTQFKYDQSGNLTNLIDGKLQETAWLYDEYSRVTNKLDDLGEDMFVYGYNVNGWLTNRWTPEKFDTFYSYDKVGNFTTVTYPNQTNQFAYDALNRLTNMTDAVGITRYGYTEGGFLHWEDGPWSFDTIIYSYENRKRAEMRILSQNGSEWAQSYDYDGANRLTNIVSPAGSFGYTYQPSLAGVTIASGLIKQLALPNGANITNAFDTSARLLQTHLRNSTGGLLNRHDYVYNVGNQRTKQTRTASDYVDYTYDPIGQLETATGKEANNSSRLHEKFGYAYDEAGNLNFRTNNALIQTFSVNSVNQISDVTRNGGSILTVAGTTTSEATDVTVSGTGLSSGYATLYGDFTWSREGASPSGSSSDYTAIAQDSLGRSGTHSITVHLPTNAVYQYDLNGNLTNDSRHVFSFDDENQLTGIVVSNEWKAEFAYDGKMRRRVEKNYEWRNDTWTKTSETRFVYDGKIVVQERNENNFTLVTLTRGKDLSGNLEGAGGIGGLLARTDHTSKKVIKNSLWNPPIQYQSYTTDFYHSDGNGNVTMLVDANQLIAAKYIYDSFGRTLSKSGLLADENRYQFSSKPIHQLSGMYDYLYRWYAPEIQRWLNRDPIQEEGGLNLYGFVANNAIDWFDPFGLDRASCLNDCLNQLTDCLNSNLAATVGLGGVGGIWLENHRTAGGGQRRFCAPGGGSSSYSRSLIRGGLGGVALALLYINIDCYSSYAGCRSGCPDACPTPPPSRPHGPTNPPGPPNCNVNTPPQIQIYWGIR